MTDPGSLLIVSRVSQHWSALTGQLCVPLHRPSVSVLSLAGKGIYAYDAWIWRMAGVAGHFLQFAFSSLCPPFYGYAPSLVPPLLHAGSANRPLMAFIRSAAIVPAV